MVKLVAYNTKDRTWGAVHYPLDPVPAVDGAWVGLSEITIRGDWAYIVERDNLVASKRDADPLLSLMICPEHSPCA
jgi:hypothetical protein